MNPMQKLGIQDAERAIEAYAREPLSDLEDIRNHLGSLLTDLMHLCDNHGLGFDAALQIARDIYQEDIKPISPPSRESVPCGR